MKKKLFMLAASIFVMTMVNAQTKIKDGTVTGSSALPNSAAILELESNNKGLLLPRVNLTSTTAWDLTGSPVNGMVIYDTTVAITGSLTYPAASGGRGLYYWDGTGWVAASSSNGWLLNGNTGTTPPASVGSLVSTANYWGTSDAKNLAVGTNGITRMIFDIAGNAYGGTDNSYVTPATSAGGNNRNFIWGRTDSLVDPSGTGNHNANAIFGSFNKVIGGSAAYGSTNVVGGGSNIVAASASAVFGNSNIDSGLLTVVGGGHNTVTPTVGGSIVVGGSLTAIDGNYLSGTNAAVFGKSNNDSAAYTLVAGQNNIISSTGANSTISGNNNVIGSNNEMATGYYNAFTTGSGSSVDTDGLLQVGNGTSSVRSNAVTVLKNGNTAVGKHTAKPSSTLQVNGSFANALRVVTGSDNLTANDHTIVCDFTGSAAITLTLPDPATCNGRIYKIVSYNNAGITFSRDVKTLGGTMPAGTVTLKGGQVVGSLNPNGTTGGIPVGSTTTIQSNGVSWYWVGL